MTIITFYLNSDEEYKSLLNDLIKYGTIFITFHILMHLQYSGKNVPASWGLTGNYFNDDFINIFVFILLGLLTYNLIMKKVIKIE